MGAIIKISIRGIRTHLGRLALTLVAITLGVGFVSGSFILTDSMTEVFDSIVERSSADTDGQVQPITDLEFGELEVTLPDTLTDELADLPEVGEAVGFVAGEPSSFLIIDEEGEPVENFGPPILLFSWDGESSEEGFLLLDGAAPVGLDEVAIDTNQADKAGVVTGDVVKFSTPNGPQELTVSGIISFEGAAGAWFTLFDLPTAQHQFNKVGTLDAISLQVAPTTDAATMLAQVQTMLPDGVEVIDQTQVIEDSGAEFNQFINAIKWVLLGFAGVALFVSLFIIKNTFSILVGQRTQEIGMLRAIGAGSRHIKISIMVEAVILGVVGAIVGLFAGIGVSKAIQALLSGGGGFPDIGTVISTRTVIVTLIVGVVATVGSAMLPAFAAGKVSPIAAMNGTEETDDGGTLRTTVGAIALVIGIVLMGLGLFVGGLSATLVVLALALGVALCFTGVAMLSVVLAGPMVRVLGAPFSRFAGTAGRMAVQNATRSPQRTASTASALMIGLTLVTTVMVLGQSIKTSATENLTSSMQADIFVFGETEGNLPSGLADVIAQDDKVELVGQALSDEVRIDGESTWASGFDTATGTGILDFGASAEDIRGLSDDGIILFEDKADDLGLIIGDTVEVSFVDGAAQTMTIEVLVPTQGMFTGTNWFMDTETMLAHHDGLTPFAVGVVLGDGVDVVEATAELDQLVSQYGSITALNQADFRDEISGMINTVIMMINGLLGLALIVAAFGIVNTMVLSVLERTREIGLLRAVGMTRRQLRAVVRWEGVIVSMYGAVLGIALGVLFAWAALSAIPDSFVSSITIPWTSLIIIVVGSGALGVLAAFFPARRAAKMDVLEAIATS